MWTDEITEELRRLSAEGHSSAQMAVLINAKFGTSFSRNAVIGRTKRRSIELRHERRGPSIKGPKRERTTSIRIKPPPRVKHLPKYDGPALPIYELTSRNQCRYAVGYEDGEHRFCGQPTEAGPWCDRHYKMVFRQEGT
jgi:GcrA cell cycle regulator